MTKNIEINVTPTNEETRDKWVINSSAKRIIHVSNDDAERVENAMEDFDANQTEAIYQTERLESEREVMWQWQSDRPVDDIMKIFDTAVTQTDGFYMPVYKEEMAKVLTTPSDIELSIYD